MVAIAIALPLLLAVAVAVIGIAGRVTGGPAPAETSPLAVASVDAPQATSPSCTALLASLDGDLPAGDRTLPSRPLADPRPAGVRAWAASPRPVVLRCGLPRPAELAPTSSLLQIDGVQWLALDDGLPQPQLVTYVAVDRPVFVALTVPTGLGSGPVQAVSDVVRNRLVAVPVPVR
jgi:Protein of unknown function (DUF3515)